MKADSKTLWDAGKPEPQSLILPNPENEAKMAEPVIETSSDFEAFVSGLTELSLKHRIGIAGDPVLFVLEDVDLDRAYVCDADSRLTF